MGRGAWSWTAVALLVLTGLAATLPQLAPEARALTAHAPIAVTSDADFTAANGVTAGSGTLADPFVIEGWDIQAYGAYGILISDTTAAFLIRNVSVWADYGYAGVLIRNATDGRFEDSTSLSDVWVDTSTRVSMSRISTSGSHLSATDSSDLLFANFTDLGGVGILQSSDVVFQDNDVPGFTSGVYFGGHDNGRGSNYTIVRNRFTPIAPWLVYMGKADGLTIAHNEFNGVGLDVSDIRFSTIRNNSFHDVPFFNGQGWGLHLFQVQNVEVTDNVVRGVPGLGVYVQLSSNLTITGNNLTSWASGLGIENSLNATVSANRLKSPGIWVYASELPQIASHTFGPDNTVDGLPVVAYRDCTDVTVDSAPVAQLFISNCKRVHVRDLTVANVAGGIMLAAVDDVAIEGNSLANITGQGAIQVFGGTNVDVRGNHVTGSWIGLQATQSRNATISENTFEQNGFVGVIVSGTVDGRAFHNNFIHSAWYDHDQARGIDNTNFTWDDGYPSGGNYWSDYRDTDWNGDGIGDIPYTFAYPGGVDRYPLILPYGRAPIPPVAMISTDSPSPETGQSVGMSGYGSTDEDGTVLWYSWDFGDGTTGFGRDVYHQFVFPGNYTVTLTAKDNSGLTDNDTMVFRVTGAPTPPVAYFDLGPLPPLYPGTTVFFNAEGSWTRFGTITSYDWDFGDGSSGSGMRVNHIFPVAGTYTVTLTVRNTWGVPGSTAQDITITVVPDIPLVPYSHPSGFSLPVPSQWGRTENERFGDTEIDLVLSGPQHDNFLTNILVDGISDSTVREDRASMEALVTSLLDDLRGGDPSMVVVEAPTYRSISGHATAVFAVQYYSDSVEQKLALVVSEAHQEVWLLLLTVRIAYFPLYNATFERMIDGFVITATPRTSLILIGVGVIAAVVASVILVVHYVRRRAARRPQAPAFAPPANVLPTPPPPATTRYCVDCGRPLEERDRFCSECGSLVKGPPGPPTPPQT